MECVCNKCGMAVKGFTCAKCDSELVEDSITSSTGNKIKVSKCPNGCGMIKSPTCCGQDMVCNQDTIKL